MALYNDMQYILLNTLPDSFLQQNILLTVSKGWISEKQLC